MKIIFTSGRETDYTRNIVLLKAIKTFSNIYVVQNTRNKISYNTIKSSYKAYRIFKKDKSYIIWAGFLGQGIALALAATKASPIVLDALVSLHETLCEDRRVLASNSLIGRCIYLLEKLSMIRSDLIITDTLSNSNFLSKKFSINIKKFKNIYVSCDEDIFKPIQVNRYKDRIEVFTYNSFLKLHGNDVILKAAKKLSNCKGIKIVLGGDGIDLDRMIKQARYYNLNNLEFIGWIPMKDLPYWIARADICLGGHFSNSRKASAAISTKTFQFIAMNRPVILGYGEGNKELFTHDVNAYFVPMGDSEALAEAIRTLADDPARRARIAESGRELFERQLTRKVLAEELRKWLTELQQ